MRISDWSSDVCSSDLRIAGQPELEADLHRILDEAGGLGRTQLLLGLALELRVVNEDRQHDAGTADHVVGHDLRRALVAGQLAIGAKTAVKRGAQRRLMAAALRRWDGFAIGTDEAVLVQGSE